MRPARPTPQARSAWVKRLQRLAKDVRSAEEALHVGIHDAANLAGLTQADIAHAIGDKSPTTIKAKVAKGKAILEAKRR